ncbi:hypothetical protein GGI02_005428, partial [Coemansia sp. RSA 2322]
PPNSPTTTRRRLIGAELFRRAWLSSALACCLPVCCMVPRLRVAASRTLKPATMRMGTMRAPMLLPPILALMMAMMRYCVLIRPLFIVCRT